MKIVQVRLSDFTRGDYRTGDHGGYYNYEFAISDHLQNGYIVADNVDFGPQRRNYSALKSELKIITEIE